MRNWDGAKNEVAEGQAPGAVEQLDFTNDDGEDTGRDPFGSSPEMKLKT
jgi:hypothetical protein